MTLGEYIVAAENRYRQSNGIERKGQAYYNTLAIMRPDLADKVVGTTLDPFYKDEPGRVFFQFLTEHEWSA